MKVSIISCYSPHCTADESEMAAFYKHLEEGIYRGKLYKFLVKDFSSRLGTVVIANVHAIELFFDGYGRYYMEPNEAVVRHYRDIHSGNWEKLWLPYFEEFGEFSMTDYPAKHMKTLTENVQRRLHYVYGGMHQ
ncbi:unnamed protein product [Angiostrongylus costaricensis]|uniref:Glycosyltransferase family 92 protein n=1 Tax=Angiostrongylus costaricensis TaxID=334426 RepID=A0A0R3PI30_ANGCS|nr:unnamed protein product [Angiostrongylus costaricensis]